MKLYSDEELAEILNHKIFHLIGNAADRLGVRNWNVVLLSLLVMRQKVL